MEHISYVIVFGLGLNLDTPRQHIYLDIDNYNQRVGELISSFDARQISYLNGYKVHANLETGMLTTVRLHHRYRAPKPVRELNPPVHDFSAIPF